MNKNPFCHCKPATHAHCVKCNTVRFVAFKPAKYRGKVLSFSKFEGGSLVCEACGHEIAHLYREQAPARKSPSLLDKAVNG